MAPKLFKVIDLTEVPHFLDYLESIFSNSGLFGYLLLSIGVFSTECGRTPHFFKEGIDGKSDRFKSGFLLVINFLF